MSKFKDMSIKKLHERKGKLRKIIISCSRQIRYLNIERTLSESEYNSIVNEIQERNDSL